MLDVILYIVSSIVVIVLVFGGYYCLLCFFPACIGYNCAKKKKVVHNIVINQASSAPCNDHTIVDVEVPKGDQRSPVGKCDYPQTPAYPPQIPVYHQPGIGANPSFPPAPNYSANPNDLPPSYSAAVFAINIPRQ